MSPQAPWPLARPLETTCPLDQPEGCQPPLPGCFLLQNHPFPIADCLHIGKIQALFFPPCWRSNHMENGIKKGKLQKLQSQLLHFRQTRRRLGEKLLCSTYLVLRHKIKLLKRSCGKDGEPVLKSIKSKDYKYWRYSIVCKAWNVFTGFSPVQTPNSHLCFLCHEKTPALLLDVTFFFT